MTNTFDLTPASLGITVSSALWGTIAGATLAGFAAERFGRRDSLRFTAALYLLSAVGCALAGIATIFLLQTHRELLLWLLIGFCASFSFSLGPVIWVYISEVFPNTVRGKEQSLGSLTH